MMWSLVFYFLTQGCQAAEQKQSASGSGFADLRQHKPCVRDKTWPHSCIHCTVYPRGYTGCVEVLLNIFAIYPQINTINALTCFSISHHYFTKKPLEVCDESPLILLVICCHTKACNAFALHSQCKREKKLMIIWGTFRDACELAKQKERAALRSFCHSPRQCWPRERCRGRRTCVIALQWPHKPAQQSPPMTKQRARAEFSVTYLI